MTNGQDLFSVKDTCQRLGGISRATYYRLVNSGDLQKVSIGSRAFTPADSLNAYLKKIGA
ncbi:MAG: helix-turn-helix domain-containing protein [Rhodospirillales bacterium]|jgi:predicted DNA-binding transcriptional regulator AlpA|nr:helix-turn-helix domain-containing protein [Rhodospirillales bacterium]MBT4627492.1 helix-turn-helix domain-containing protein [Rhodospirillales bacterium]MBT5350992.1 helix-turn-helix domain-containing protein [Rhodospirillales bacterium]MBT6824973.1 helix-turn-helix domain-containing protein [Rhodospirillales bacterium]MBT7505433.1 helix-turn-helix domain-containing protein [Rhodospirillales bacterium]